MTRPAILTPTYGADAMDNPSTGKVLIASKYGNDLYLQRDDGLITATSSDTHGATSSNFLMSNANGGLTLDRLNLGTATGA